jgi:hypothetical protein
MKIKINEVEVSEAMLDVAARVAGFSDGLQVAIELIRKEAPQIRFLSARALLENIARKIEQDLPGVVSVYADSLAQERGWRKLDEDDTQA